MIQPTRRALSPFLSGLLALGAVSGLCSGARADSGAVEGCAKGSETQGFWKRLSESYQKHLFPGDAAAAAADSSAPDAAPFDEEMAGYRKDLAPPPVANPPWPYSVYNEGGT